MLKRSALALDPPRGGAPRADRPDEGVRRARGRARSRLVRGALLFLALLLGDLGRAAASGASKQGAVSGLDIYRARWWNISNGLPQSSINDLLQTEDGELWVATFGGLLRFDGVEFRSFDLNTLPGLASIRITSLASDGANGIWFATQNGALSHLRAGKLVETATLPVAGEILCLVRAPDGSLWIQLSGGAVRRFSGGTWSEVVQPGLGGNYNGLCVDRDGSVCAAVGDELLRFDDQGREVARIRAPSKISSVAPRAQEGSGPWVGLVDGPALLEQGTIARFASDPPLRMNITAMLDDGRGSLWIGSSKGFVRLTIAEGPARPLVLESNDQITSGFDVRALLVDRESNLWLGSATSGLIRLRLTPIQALSVGVEFGPATALCDDGDGGAFVARNCHGLVHFRVGSSRVEQVDLGVAASGAECVHALLFDSRERLWVGADTTWLRREPGAGEPFTAVLAGRSFTPRVGHAVELPNGDVWLSSLAGELVRLAPDDTVVEELTLPVAPTTLAAGPKGELWIGGDGCVLRHADGVLTRFDRAQGVPPGDVRDLLPEEDGGVWIATYGGGLAYLADGRARRISRSEGLSDSSLTRVLDDGYGRLWILSNRGLIVAERSELLDVLGGRRAHVEPVVIGPEAGMNESSFGAPAGFRSPSGHLWFGTIGGPARVDASRFPFNRVVSVPSVERLLADDQELARTDGVEVPAGTRRLVFEFTAFTLTAPERAKFRYRLQGYDEEWVDGGGQRRAAYTGVWPGSYVFRVLACNEEGVWGEQPAELAIVVLPSWWQTRWFGLVAALLAAGVLFAVHRLRVSVLDRRARVQLELTRARAEAEERESRLREELAHVARVATAGELATSLAHEVNQPLAAIATNAQAGRRFLARDGVRSADLDEILTEIGLEAQRASEVIRRLREFLRKHSTERRNLDVGQVVRDTLPLVRRELADNKVELGLELAAGLPLVDADPVQLQQVLVNLVKNACEAMAGTPGPHRIDFATRMADGRVELEVRDSGPGLSPEIAGRLFEPFVTTKPTGMGLGLAICRSIVEAHGGSLGAVPGSRGGMIFRVELPASAHEESKR